MKFVIFAPFLFLVCVCYPNIPESFVSTTTVTRIFPTVVTETNEIQTEDSVNQRTRIDTVVNGAKISLFKFYSNHTQFMYNSFLQVCVKGDLSGNYANFFTGWLPYSRQNGTCTYNNR